MNRRTSLLRTSAALFLSAAWATQGHPQLTDDRGLRDGDRPSMLGVIGGAAIGGLALSAGAAVVGLAAGGGSTECYEGGCAALLMTAAAWPLGSAWGATRAIRRQGYEVGFGKILAYSVVGTGLAVLTGLAVDSSNTPDWVYGAAPLGAHLLTLALLSHWTIEFEPSASAVSFAPAIFDGPPGITVQLRMW